jgi:hypothetical protein
MVIVDISNKEIYYVLYVGGLRSYNIVLILAACLTNLLLFII